MSDHDDFYEDIPAYMLGALDPDEARALELHAESCERCRHELRWLTPAVRALPDTVDRETPSPQLRARLMAEVRADVAEAADREPAAARESGGFGEWLRRLNLGGLTWKPLTGLAAIILIVAAFAGYEVGNSGGGSSTPNLQASVTKSREPSGLVAAVVRHGDRAEGTRARGLGPARRKDRTGARPLRPRFQRQRDDSDRRPPRGRKSDGHPRAGGRHQGADLDADRQRSPGNLAGENQVWVGRREADEGSALKCVTRRRPTEDTPRRRFAGGY
jgi:anti-sigma factor RsiW